jgi:hypothetical protein
MSSVFSKTCLANFLAERVGFEPTSRDHREPLFESGALSQLGNLSQVFDTLYFRTLNSPFLEEVL